MSEETLIDRIDRAVERSSASGNLQPISTDCDVVCDGGVDFVVWRVEEIERKEEATRRQREAEEELDPFAPPYGDLLVEELSETHVCLLNKFNVLDRHVLIVTRDFEDQASMVTRRDFEALWQCLFEVDGLGFYNGGEIAGASQPHKHLQLVDLPMVEEIEGVPMASAWEPAVLETGEVRTAPSLPFEHVLVRLPPLEPPEVSVPQVADASYQYYRRMLDEVFDTSAGGQLPPYNLLVTRRWMCLVPRSREYHEGISINALGFAGSMLVRDDEEFQILEETGPMAMLREVGT